MKRIAAEAEALCRAVVPELESRPLYVVLPAGLRTELSMVDGLAGLTMRHLDLILRPTLEPRGRWRGRGAAMIVDPAAIRTTLAHRERSSRRRAFMPVFLGIVLHELAHILDADLLGGREPEPGLVELARQALVADMDGTLSPTNGPGAAIPWFRHEWQFIRLALHLAYRFAALRNRVLTTDVLDTAEYGLSPTWKYLSTLGDEPKRLMGCDFATIRATPPPAGFAALWRSDIRGWLSQIPMTDEISRMLAAGGCRSLISTVELETPPESREAGVGRIPEPAVAPPLPHRRDSSWAA